MTYGLPFNGDEDAKGLLLLNAVEETICRQLRACKSTSSKRRLLEGTFLLSISFFRILNAYNCRIEIRSEYSYDGIEESFPSFHILFTHMLVSLDLETIS